MNSGIRLRLSVMMFLQYFAWGAWFVTLGSYIGANTGASGNGMFADGFIGRAYGTAAIGGMIAPFFVGMIADRFFSTERILAVLHLLGAGVLFMLSQVDSQTTFYFTLIAFFLCYMPTLALTNSLSFHHLPDPGKQFPGIRVLGTIGWIVAGLLVGYLRTEQGQIVGLHMTQMFGVNIGLKIGDVTNASSIEVTALPMRIAAIAQAVLAVFCLVLPHTPPGNKGAKVSARDILGL
ncbi:MAG: MFS transporter, partial [Planctomycetaceae bacterium]|nr:MFS transporter [Planctomycetaceae bacterium]